MGALNPEMIRALHRSMVAQRRQHLLLIWGRGDVLLHQEQVYFEMVDGTAQIRYTWTPDKRVSIALIEVWDPAEVHLMHRLDFPRDLALGDSVVFTFNLEID